jgi:hypothetical protein
MILNSDSWCSFIIISAVIISYVFETSFSFTVPLLFKEQGPYMSSNPVNLDLFQEMVYICIAILMQFFFFFLAMSAQLRVEKSSFSQFIPGGRASRLLKFSFL